MEKLRVINFFAGPGAGKSTSAAGVFAALKLRGVRAELVTEVAKDATYEGHHFLLGQQVFLFAEQFRRQARCIGQREVVITDSPILLPAFLYNDGWSALADLALEAWDKFENINFFINRVKAYDTEGRNQTEEEALEKDRVCKRLLASRGIQFGEITGDQQGIDAAVEYYVHNYVDVNKYTCAGGEYSCPRQHIECCGWCLEGLMCKNYCPAFSRGQGCW